jgi:hypothetical protein
MRVMASWVRLCSARWEGSLGSDNSVCHMQIASVCVLTQPPEGGAILGKRNGRSGKDDVAAFQDAQTHLLQLGE